MTNPPVIESKAGLRRLKRVILMPRQAPPSRSPPLTPKKSLQPDTLLVTLSL